MKERITDFSGADDEIIRRLAEKLRDTDTFNARKQTDKDGVEQIKIKVIDSFNYVTHVYFRTGENDTLQSAACDGTGRYCGKVFCEHCKAAYDYLKSSGVFPVFLPDQAPAASFTGMTETPEQLEPPVEVCPEEPSPDSDHTEEISKETSEKASEEVSKETTDTEEPETPFEPRGMTILLGTDKQTGEPVLLMPNHNGYHAE